MKNFARKIGSETCKIENIALFTRNDVGTHLGMILDKGKLNSIIIGITHSKTLPHNFKTVSCEFNSLVEKKDMEYVDKIRKSESKAILTIVDNRTMSYKNHRILQNLKYKTGLLNQREQENLKEGVLLKNKLTHLSNEYNNLDSHILYQTKSKTEAISINNEGRLIELIGKNAYDIHIKSLLELSSTIGDKRLSIVDILKDRVDRDGVGKVLEILNKWV